MYYSLAGMQGFGLGRRVPSCYHTGSARGQSSLDPGIGQWIVVYDVPSHEPMNQRLHECVTNTDLEQHFKKAKGDGLYISCVTCYPELWTLVVDAGTGFSAQVSHKTCGLCISVPSSMRNILRCLSFPP